MGSFASQKKWSPVIANYQIHGRRLAVTNEAKYLGVKLHHKLQWSPHINTITKKANSTRAFLQRNLYGCSNEIRSQAYTSFVRPTLEYAAAAWDPIGKGNKGNIELLEAAQRRCARFVLQDFRRTSSVSAMLNVLGWASLQERRQRAKAVIMYNIINRNIDIPHDYLPPPNTNVSHWGAHIKFINPYSRTNVMKHSFFPSGIALWNHIPSSVSNAPSVDAFRAGLAKTSLCSLMKTTWDRDA